ncbi:MAG: group II intron maturase-specific domain-containing protein [Planctomycetaceae bacterium]
MSSCLRGWRGYVRGLETPSVLRNLNFWLHRRLRAVLWKQWKTSRRRSSEHRRLGVSHDLAAKTAGSCRGPWRLYKSPALHKALSTQCFQTLALVARRPAAPSLNQRNRRVPQTRTHVDLGGAKPRSFPLSRLCSGMSGKLGSGLSWYGAACLLGCPRP